jgi:hypothetical protein
MIWFEFIRFEESKAIEWVNFESEKSKTREI